MADLTDAEEKWLKRVQRALDACPSDRIGFYTTGDPCVTAYRLPEVGDLDDNEPMWSNRDFCMIVHDADARLGELNFPSLVHSTAG